MNVRRTTEQIARTVLGTDRIKQRIAEITGTPQFREAIAAASGVTEMQQRIAEITGTPQFREAIAAASGVDQMQKRMLEALGLDRIRETMGRAAGLDGLTDRLADHVLGTDAISGMLTGLAGRLPVLDPDFFPRMRRAFERIMPRNLRGVDGVRFADLFQIMEDEGIPFCLVPDGETAVALLDAADARQRRGVLVARAEPIFDACEGILRLCVMADLAYPGSQIREAIGAYRAGFRTAAQSLATTVLDSTFRTHEAVTHRAFVVGSRTLPGGIRGVAFLDTLDLARSLALRPLVRVHAKQRPDEPPTTYSRNATTHEVTPEQYTDANAVQAIMLATSVLGFVQGLW